MGSGAIQASASALGIGVALFSVWDVTELTNVVVLSVLTLSRLALSVAFCVFLGQWKGIVLDQHLIRFWTTRFATNPVNRCREATWCIPVVGRVQRTMQNADLWIQFPVSSFQRPRFSPLSLPRVVDSLRRSSDISLLGREIIVLSVQQATVFSRQRNSRLSSEKENDQTQKETSYRFSPGKAIPVG